MASADKAYIPKSRRDEIVIIKKYTMKATPKGWHSSAFQLSIPKGCHHNKNNHIIDPTPKG
jgi:hypothetical protein